MLLFRPYWLPLILIFIVSIPIRVYAQKPASQLADYAGILYDNQQYDSALIVVDLAIEKYQQASKYDTLMDTYGAKAQYSLLGVGPDAAILVLDEAVSIGTKYLPKFHEAWVEIYYQYINANGIKGDHNAAEKYVNLALENLSNTNLPPQKIGRARWGIARIYHEMRKHKEGLENAQIAKRAFLQANPDTSSSYYGVINTIASIHLYNSTYDSALVYARENLYGVKKKFGEDHFNTGAGLNLIASLYHNLDRYPEAVSSYKEAERIFDNFRVRTGQDVYVNIIRTNLALLYMDLHEYDLALDYAKNVMPGDIRNYGETSPQLLYNLGRLIGIYHNLDQPEKAQPYIDQLNKILEANPDMSHSNKSYALNFILSQHVRTGSIDKARKSYDSYKRNYQRSGEKINKTYIAASRELALAYRNHGNVDSAAILYKSAIKAYKRLFPIQDESILSSYIQYAALYKDDRPELAFSLLDTAINNFNYPVQHATFFDAIKNSAPSAQIPEFVSLSIELLANNPDKFTDYYTRILSIISVYNEYLESYFSVIRTQQRIAELGNFNIKVYGLVVEACLQNDDVEKAFVISEMGRSLGIRLALNQYASEHYANIPDSIRNKELKLIRDVQQYNLQRYDRELSDSAQIESTLSFDESIEEFQSFKLKLKNEYPEYYKLKYAISALDIKQVKSELGKNKTLLTYRMLGDRLAAFIVTKNFVKVHLYDDKVPESEIAALQRDLNRGRVNDELQRNLCQLLIEPVKDFLNTRELIIVPDGALYYLNFEILKDGDSYLFDKYVISNAIAADLFYSASNVQKHGDWISFAPGFEDDFKKPFIDSLRKGVFMDSSYINYLKQPSTVELVEKLPKIADALVYIGPDATESEFKRMHRNTPVLFIGSHAEVNDVKPYLSRIVFAKSIGKHSLEDGYLHAYEVYGNSMDVDLAILTACNTGIGSIADGEGILSLSHSFSYAGCPSIVMTKWSVDEIATVEIAEYFLSNLKDGMSKNKALHEAKMHYRNNHPDDLNSAYYWAGLSLIGDTDQIYTSGLPVYIYVLAGIVLTAMLWLVFKKLK